MSQLCVVHDPRNSTRQMASLIAMIITEFVNGVILKQGGVQEMYLKRKVLLRFGSSERDVLRWINGGCGASTTPYPACIVPELVQFTSGSLGSIFVRFPVSTKDGDYWKQTEGQVQVGLNPGLGLWKGGNMPEVPEHIRTMVEALKVLTSTRALSSEEEEAACRLSDRCVAAVREWLKGAMLAPDEMTLYLDVDL